MSTLYSNTVVHRMRGIASAERAVRRAAERLVKSYILPVWGDHSTRLVVSHTVETLDVEIMILNAVRDLRKERYL